MPEVYDFGAFHLDAAERLLLRDGRPVSLPPKAFDLLCDLVRHAGHLREKQPLMEVLWPDTFVEEANLTYTVSALRKALGDSRDAPVYIETVPTKGYRFVGDVRTPVPPAPIVAPDRVPSPSPPPGRWWRSNVLSATILTLLSVALVVAGLTWRRPTTTRISSIVVLPLESTSGGPDHVAEGLTDELITEFSRLAQLKRVINRQTARHYRHSTLSTSAIGRELGVDALLTGSVQGEGSRVRITAQLVSAGDDRVLWAGSYDREMADTFALQRELVLDVIRHVNVELLPGADARPTQRVDPVAYDLYLQALAAFNQLDVAHVHRALTLLQQATDRAPTLARAHALRAMLLVYGMMFQLVDADGGRPMREAADKAIALDGLLGEAYSARGMVFVLFEWDWARAEAAFRRGVTLAPNSSLTHIQLAHYLGQRARYDESLAEARRAMELDPTSDATAATLFWAHLHARHFAECAERGTRLQYDIAHGFANFCRARLGQPPALCAGEPDHPLCGYAALVAGDPPRARASFAKACAGLPGTGEVPDGVDPFCLQLAAALGNREPMLRWAETLVRRRDSFPTFFRGPDTYDFLRDEPRFQAVLDAVGLPR
jgi:TolB-like protein/DNA-binding winged helix-turn-helix (wHTH) protein